MVTFGMDLSSLSLRKPHEKLPKSISLVTIFLLIGSPCRILYVFHTSVIGVKWGDEKDPIVVFLRGGCIEHFR